MKGKACVTTLVGFFILSLFFAAPAVFAVEGKFSLEFFVQSNPIFSGSEAGGGANPPEYNDAFDWGTGAGIEFNYRVLRWISVLGGVAYQKFDGDTTNSITFENFNTIPIYGGGKFHFLSQEKKWDPYLRLDIGPAYLTDVNANGSKYWDNSWILFFAAGIGLKYKYDDTIHIGTEIKVQRLGDPESVAGAVIDSTAEESWSLPIRVGFIYNF
jgi:hypothetical protein